MTLSFGHVTHWIADFTYLLCPIVFVEYFMTLWVAGGGCGGQRCSCRSDSLLDYPQSVSQWWLEGHLGYKSNSQSGHCHTNAVWDSNTCWQKQRLPSILIFPDLAVMFRLPGSCRCLTSQVAASLGLHRTDMMFCWCVSLRGRLQMPPHVGSLKGRGHIHHDTCYISLNMGSTLARKAPPHACVCWGHSVS